MEEMAIVYGVVKISSKYLFHTEQEILDYNLAALAIKEFHSRVLENSCVSLPLLREIINQWLVGKDS